MQYRGYKFNYIFLRGFMRTDTRNLYLHIRIEFTNKRKEFFNWSSKGNIVFGVAVVKEEVIRKIKIEDEKLYSISVLLRDNIQNTNLYKITDRNGSIRLTIDDVEAFIGEKLGITLVKCIRRSIKEAETINTQQTNNIITPIMEKEEKTWDYSATIQHIQKTTSLRSTS